MAMCTPLKVNTSDVLDPCIENMFDFYCCWHFLGRVFLCVPYLCVRI